MTIEFSSGKPAKPKKPTQKTAQTKDIPADSSKQAVNDVIDKLATQVSARKAASKKNASAPSTTDSERKGVLKSQETDVDKGLDQTIRPKRLHDYIGQGHLKNNLSISLEAAKMRKEPLDHTLLYGPPGLGKTTLAMVLATEMETDIHITAAPALERPRDIIGILMSLTSGTVLFIDEIHRLNKVTEEILYPAMEDYTLDRTIGKGESTKILRVPLPKFTLIGATTKAGSIASPLRDRFGMVHRLNFYTEEELRLIVQRSAGLLNIAIDDAGSQAIACRSRGTPRIVNRLLRRVRDFADVKKAPGKLICESTAQEALDLFDIDHLGLDATDRQMLKLMIDNFGGGPVGLETLASSLGEDARTLEDVYEPYLLQSGLLHRTPRGRAASPKAYQHLGYEMSARQMEEWTHQPSLLSTD